MSSRRNQLKKIDGKDRRNQVGEEDLQEDRTERLRSIEEEEAVSIAPETEGSIAIEGLVNRRRVERRRALDQQEKDDELSGLSKDRSRRQVDRSARVEDPSGLTRSSLLIRHERSQRERTLSTTRNQGIQQGTPVNRTRKKEACGS